MLPRSETGVQCSDALPPLLIGPEIPWLDAQSRLARKPQIRSGRLPPHQQLGFPAGCVRGKSDPAGCSLVDEHYIGKHTLFRKPYGWFFRSLGGIPVDRRRKASLAQQLAERFDEADDFILGLAPEGTRSKTDHWKSGFYHIARAAKVPIAMAYLDYGHKEVGMGGEFMPGKDIDEVYDRIRSFFEGRLGKHPEKASTIDRRRDVQERRAGAT